MILLLILKNQIPATIEQIIKETDKDYLRKIMVVYIAPRPKLK